LATIGINGFGRIGRQAARVALSTPGIEIGLINDLWGADSFAHLFKYDTNYGEWPEPVRAEGNSLIIGERRVPFCSERKPSEVPWSQHGVDIVVESTGYFRDATARGHLEAGAKKVIVAAPGKGVDLTVVFGVNHTSYDPSDHHVLSMASCTTNCAVPVLKVLHEEFRVQRGMFVTVHAYTGGASGQVLLDAPHKDPRRARAAAVNIIPTSTGAAEAVGLVLPELRGRLDCYSLRVPTTTVSLLDVTVEVGRPTTVEEINEAMVRASEGDLAGVLGVSREPLVSCDFRGNPHTAVIDLPLTAVLDGTLAKVVAWYDNEWAYASKLVELAQYLIERGL